MIDTKELRRLVEDDGKRNIDLEEIHELLDRLEAAESDGLEQARLLGMSGEREAALLSKLEAAEKERDALRAEITCVKEVEFPRKAQTVADAWKGKCERLEAERDALRTELNEIRYGVAVAHDTIKALRAKIEEMEKQEPVATAAATHKPGEVGYCTFHKETSFGSTLYALPGAQPAPIAQDESVRKAWVRFSNAMVSGDDAPYPGMSEAFEQHFSQSFTDRDWRAESGTWAAAWKAAKRHEAQAQPAPDGFVWPECPKRRQSHVLFDDGYEEGWAACISTVKAMLASAPKPEAKP